MIVIVVFVIDVVIIVEVLIMMGNCDWWDGNEVDWVVRSNKFLLKDEIEENIEKVLDGWLVSCCGWCVKLKFGVG